MILNEPLPPMPNIPSELLTEILSMLSMLPVESLLRFRSTSNSLLSLIDSYNFTTLHLKNFFNFNLIVRCDSDFYKLDFHNLSIAYPGNRIMLTSNNNRVTLFGSCNGLLCISKVPDHITFLNPNIRKYRNLPKPPLLIEQKQEEEEEEEEDTRDSICNHGFGFDPLTENYKLVRITSFGGT
ncbi:putative F-box domain-containing protein [Medicago truncatula]|nr:putative F-box domain-containing protein [Medicago truncatula]